MEEALYQVVITGHVLEPIPLPHAICAFANLFSITQEEALSRFDHAPCVVRGRLSHEHAEKYCRVMRRLGIGCRLQEEAPEPERRGCSLYPRLTSML